MKKITSVIIIGILSLTISSNVSAASSEISTFGAPFGCTGPCHDR